MKTQIIEFNFEKSSYEKLCLPPSSPGSNPRASGYGSEWWVVAAAVMVVFGVERWLWLSGTCGGMVVVSAKTTRLLWMTKNLHWLLFSVARNTRKCLPRLVVR